MKRIVALCLLAIIFCCSLLTFASCSGDDAPDGMRLVKGSEALGYYFYAPEEWVVANRGNIASTYVSKLDTTSISFAEAKMPEGEPGLDTVRSYFESYKSSYPSVITVTSDIAECKFGNATLAYKTAFKYIYDEVDVGCMQIFVYANSCFYIFTYTSYNSEKNDGVSYYQFYMDKVSAVIDNFKFVTPNGSVENTKEYKKDADGYILVSDKTLSDFDLYVPSSYSVDFSSGMVSVSDAEGRNINVSRATHQSTSFLDYWERRKQELSLLIDTRLDENGNALTTLEYNDEDILKAVSHKDARSAASFEYSYLMKGIKYRVYQVLLTNNTDAFVFTYTAKDDCFDAGLADALTSLSKMDF